MTYISTFSHFKQLEIGCSYYHFLLKPVKYIYEIFHTALDVLMYVINHQSQPSKQTNSSI